MWPIKDKENRQLLILWPNLMPYSQLQNWVVTVLLLTSTPLVQTSKAEKGKGRCEGFFQFSFFQKNKSKNFWLKRAKKKEFYCYNAFHHGGMNISKLHIRELPIPGASFQKFSGSLIEFEGIKFFKDIWIICITYTLFNHQVIFVMAQVAIKKIKFPL